MMANHCTACGTPFVAGNRFCYNCGSIVQAEPMNQPTPMNQSTPMNQPIQSTNYNQQLGMSPKKPKGLIVVGIVVILLILIIGFLVSNALKQRFFNADFSNENEITNVEETYGNYFGNAKVTVKYDKDSYDESFGNPFEEVNKSEIYIDNNVLYYDFFVENDVDSGIFDNFTTYMFDASTSKIIVEDEYTVDEQLYQIYFEGNVYVESDGLKRIVGQTLIHVEQIANPDMSVEYLIEYEAVIATHDEYVSDPSTENNENITADSIVGVWELAGDPYSRAYEVWTFKANYDVADTQGRVFGTWNQTDQQTLVIQVLLHPN